MVAEWEPSAAALAAREKWDRIYRVRVAGEAPVPARVLAEHAGFLPCAGAALDLACGLGGNALFLARHGLDTSAYDISPEALARVAEFARSDRLRVRTEARDVVAHPPVAAAFDVVVVSRFLDRGLAQPLMAALRPGGLLFYQTYTVEKSSQLGPNNPAYLLRPGELLEMFRALDTLVYREEGQDEAMLVARAR